MAEKRLLWQELAQQVMKLHECAGDGCKRLVISCDDFETVVREAVRRAVEAMHHSAEHKNCTACDAKHRILALIGEADGK